MKPRPGNDLSSNHPEIAAEWHPSKNGDLLPSEVSRGTATVVWWRAECGHEWEAPVHRRTNMKTGCPFCVKAGRKRVLPGFNDLATLHPEVASLWDESRNGKPASRVAPFSSAQTWWLCPRGHSFKSTPAQRVTSPTPCQECRITDTAVSNHPQLLAEWHPDKNDRLPDNTPFRSAYKAWWRCEAGHEWQTAVYNRAAGKGCTQCGWAGLGSKVEDELASFISGLGVSVDRNVRGLLSSGELDIVCPDQGIAIEFNGLYWHSDAWKDKNYHAEKSRVAAEVGLQLIHVWEDDWAYRPEVVKRMLARKLGKSKEPRLNARSLTPVDVLASEARDFLDRTHVQGAVGGSIRLGLSDHSGLRALMVFRSRGDGVWELARYATDAIVRGGFTRLLRQFIRTYAPSEIISFSDWGVSDGALYESTGFVRDGEIAPDYMYVVKGHREHKFNYRKARFQKDDNLTYVEGMTERELADLNGLKRIWDAGKVRWSLHP